MTIASNGGTTGIGSLPHHNVDAALEFSFRMDIPFLPQIPIRNPWEYMIAQALEGLPGLEATSDGNVSLNVSIWESRTESFRQQLEEAFRLSAFDPFEPRPSVSSSWQAFLFELEERNIRRAKVQIVGPMTAQWALGIKGGGAPDDVPGLTTQIYRLVLARAIATVRRMKAHGIEPIIYLDEPGLYGLSIENPRHLLGFSELKLMIQTLRHEGAEVGLHCCSNTNWDLILELGQSGLGILSIDVNLSLESLLEGSRAARVQDFLRNGGRLSLGVIPTTRASALRSLRAEVLFAELTRTLTQAWPNSPETVRLALSSAIYTPACGLAFHSVDDAEVILDTLSEFQRIVARVV
jgi:hypothetical protein